jgi:hypothetical protein
MQNPSLSTTYLMPNKFIEEPSLAAMVCAIKLPSIQLVVILCLIFSVIWVRLAI